MNFRCIIVTAFLAFDSCLCSALTNSESKSKDAGFLKFYEELKKAESDERVPIIVNHDTNLEDHLLELKNSGEQFPISDDYRLYLFYKKVDEIKGRHNMDVYYSNDRIPKLELEKANLEKQIKELDEKIKKQNVLMGLFSSKSDEKRKLEAELSTVLANLDRYRAKLSDGSQKLEKINQFISAYRVAAEIERLKQIPVVKAKIDAAEATDERRRKRGRKGVVL